MGNIFDYLLWRGDLDFNNSPFNEIDNLICSRISYFPMENVLNKNESITIKDLYQRLIKYKDKFKKEEPYTIVREDNGDYRIGGEEVEKLFRMANFETDEGLLRFTKRLRKMGIDDKLEEMGAKEGDLVHLLDFTFEYRK